MIGLIYTFLGSLSLILVTVLLLALAAYFCSKQVNPGSQESDDQNGFDHSNNNVNINVIVEQYPDHETRFCMNPKLLSSPKVKFCDTTASFGAASSSNSSCCSICLMDYVESDLLRVLPHCGHFFHAKCVDPWFTMRLTCPICRISLV